MRNLSWIPRIKTGERAAFESNAAASGLAGYHIKAIGADGHVETSPEHDEYFPVHFTTTVDQQDAVLGLDLADRGYRQQALEYARDEDKLAASGNFTLQVGSGDRRGFFAVLPVYRRGFPHDTVEDRRRNLVGFVQGVFETDAMLEAILGGISTPVDLQILAPGIVPTAFFWHSEPAETGSVQPLSPAPNDIPASLYQFRDLQVANTRWRLVMTPSGRLNFDSTAWFLLVAGLSATTVVSGFICSLNRFAARLVEANRKARELASTDSLTQLANRRAFLDRLAARYREGERPHGALAALYIDVDRFKDINDSHGHVVGDILLETVARRLESALGPADFAARIGGDEFAVLCANADDAERSVTLAKTIRELISAPFAIDGNQFCVTASIGVSEPFTLASGAEPAFMEADIALYRAKEDGRDCIRIYDESMRREVNERVRIGEELHGVIERGELELYYQPQVEIASSRIIGLEALVRWNHPQRGCIPPSSFIPIAERTGAIIALGKWVFEETCRQTSAWVSEGLEPKCVAVNVSTIQCKQQFFAQDVAALLARWPLAADVLEIELTESVLMEATQMNRDIVDRLRQLGLRVAIDDFGTGYSSLNYLSTYPVDRVKIAQELVIRATTDRRPATVVRAAIHLAHELGIDVIAEGVENLSQAKFLLAAGCAMAQGYYYSRPLSAPEATELLRRGFERANSVAS
jgi:diguanylate cyclase (GGDEF)-like protein